MGNWLSANNHWIEQTRDSSGASTSTSGTLSTWGTSSTQNLTCEVFLSFRGPDTRLGFTSHLHRDLKTHGIAVFIDKENLEEGFEIHPYLKKAIEKSQYAVVIISERFADSKSCLMELSEIMERKRKGWIKVFPIFYHVEPSDVRHQKGMFGKHFAQFREEVGSKVDTAEWEKWTAALKEVGELKGWPVQNREEAQIVQEISLKIFRKLVTKSIGPLFGIETQVESIMDLLRLKSGGVRFIVICGIGGIGKSTLARVIVERASPEFCATSIVDVGKHGIYKLGKQLVHDLISPDAAKSLKSEENIRDTLGRRLKNKKVLVVLDDLHEEKKLEVAKAKWFGDGSRIIITSRDRKWPCLDKDSIYDVRTLTGRAAIELFCSKASPKGDLGKEYWELVKEFVNLAKGLPLALEVYGSHVKGEGKGYWKNYRDDLKEHLDEGVKCCLKVTFDRLDIRLRDAFLDIVCFFIGSWGCLDRDHLKEKLVWLGHSSNILIDLENKSLLKFVKHEMMIVKESLYIHDLLLQMGEKIVDKERLWRDQDIISELQENSEKIEIDKLKVLWLQASSINGDKPIIISLGAFSKMKNLRIVYISAFLNRMDFCGEYSELKLSNELRYLYWYRYPFESLPAGFIPTNLIALYLNNCSIKQLWNGNKSLSKLKNIDLQFSRALKETPDFINSVPNLETLNLSNCTNLSLIHPSIGLLKHLKELNLSNCPRLEQLPDKITSTSLEVLNLQQCLELKVLPNEIHSKSLKHLNLSSCSKLENLPTILGKIPSLQYSDISEDAIKEFPFSFERLPFLEKFYAIGTHIGGLPVDIVFSKGEGVFTIEFYDLNTSLELLPSDLSSLKCQILHDVIPSNKVESSGCSGLFECSNDRHKELLRAPFATLKSNLKVSLFGFNLEAILKPIGYWPILSLDLSKNKLKELPISMCQLSDLEVLTLNDCTSLGALPNNIYELSRLKELYSNDCTSLGALPNSMCELFNLEKLHLNNCTSLGALPTGMCKLSSLKELYLNGCTSLGALPYSICELSNLVKLHLGNCTSLGALPNSMCKLSSLKELYLNGCTSLGALPNSICKLSNLEKLELNNCTSLRALPNSMYNLFSHQELYLNGCTSLGALPNSICKLSNLEKLKLNNCTSLGALPNSMYKLSSLEELYLNGCTSLGALPYSICELSNLKKLELNNCTSLGALPTGMCKLSSLEELYLNGCTSLGALPRLPLSLYSLELQNCPSLDFESLIHALIPNSIDCCSSIVNLDLSRNRVKGLLDDLCELSRLGWLDLDGCTSLQTLPKLPLSLEWLRLRNCPLLSTSVLSSLVTYIGFDCKPHMMLNTHIQDPMDTMPRDVKYHFFGPSVVCDPTLGTSVVCGPTLEPRIPEWFIHKSTSSNQKIQIHMDRNSANDSPEAANKRPDACSLLIVYEVYGNEKSKSRKRMFDELENSGTSACEGSNRIFPEFVCQLQCKEVSSQQTFIIRIPEVACVGSHGVWVFIKIPNSLDGLNYVASITASNENVKLKELAGRLLNEEADCNFFEVVGNISRPGLDSKSIGDVLGICLEVEGPLKPEFDSMDE